MCVLCKCVQVWTHLLRHLAACVNLCDVVGAVMMSSQVEVVNTVNQKMTLMPFWELNSTSWLKRDLWFIGIVVFEYGIKVWTKKCVLKHWICVVYIVLTLSRTLVQYTLGQWCIIFQWSGMTRRELHNWYLNSSTKGRTDNSLTWFLMLFKDFFINNKFYEFEMSACNLIHLVLHFAEIFCT